LLGRAADVGLVGAVVREVAGGVVAELPW
jgi:hypothetical protein